MKPTLKVYPFNLPCLKIDFTIGNVSKMLGGKLQIPILSSSMSSLL